MKPFTSRIALVLLVLVGCGKDSPKPATAVAPTVITGTASEINSTGAKIGGQVTADGDASITAQGIVYSITTGPTTASTTVASAGTGVGAYTVTLSGLLPATTYFTRAFATNSVDTSYGSEINFVTKSPVALTTTAATNITLTSATSGGEITNDDGAAVTARGVCWGTTANPTISSSKSTDGVGTGAFVSTLTGLLSGTLYYVRAYATNSSGTSYGVEITFMTLAIPTLTTKNIVNISSTTADSGGDISSDGGLTVTARGICWSTAPNPTIANNKTTNGGGTGSFNSTMTGLAQTTVYRVRAYATNAAGTAYGQEMTFITTCFTAIPGNVSYTTTVIAVGAGGSIAPCQPSVSGTTTLTETAPGQYLLGDASFGQYNCARSSSPATGIQWLVSCGNFVSQLGGDQYGAFWAYSLISNNGTTLVVGWNNSRGDSGTTSLTRVGGWPLNLSF